MSVIGNTPGVSSQRVVLEEVVTGSPKSTFTPISGYIKGYVDVLINGLEVDSTDFTATDGITVNLVTAAGVGDTVKVKAWLPRGLSDGYRKDEIDAMLAALDTSYTKEESDAKYVKLYSGKAGVGTTTPAKLFVVSNAGANGIEFSPDDASTAGLNRVLSYNRVAGAYQPLVVQGSEIRLYTKGGSADESFRVDNSGYLKFDSGYGSVGTAYGCRAWVNFNGTGTVAIRASGNVSSITDNGTGTYTVNFTTAMPDTNYSFSASSNDYAVREISRTTSALQLFNFYASTTSGGQAGNDASVMCASVFR